MVVGLQFVGGECRLNSALLTWQEV